VAENQVTLAESGGSGSALIAMSHVSKRYEHESQSKAALADINLTVLAGECVAVVGRSGSGKTTLVNLLTGIDNPSTGEVIVAGDRIHTMSQESLAVWRGRSVGIVFQFFQLLPTLTVLENVILPMEFAGLRTPTTREQRALELLERLGIVDQALKLPADLSGGQQQRAAIARALANDPPIIVADEPTGNLDSVTSDAVLALLASLALEGKTVLAVTHEREVDRFFTRTVTLRDGRIEADTALVDSRA
jgi:putative ABC transport system ATP-binding protein